MNNILYIIILSIIFGVILVSYRHYHGPYTKKVFGFDLSKLKRWHWNVIVIVVLLINLYAWLL